MTLTFVAYVTSYHITFWFENEDTYIKLLFLFSFHCIAQAFELHFICNFSDTVWIIEAFIK